jgi:hypothetical protein
MMNDVNSMFKDASSKIVNKDMFHTKNHLFPFLKFTTLRGEPRECGSITSNNIARNEAINNGDDYENLDPKKYGFPFPEMKCHYTFNK